MKIISNACICERCGHQWNPRSKDEPKICPTCKSYYWNYKIMPEKPLGLTPKRKTQQNKKYLKEYRDKSKRKCLEHYSNGTLRCSCCGESIYEFLTIDHNNNDGAVHRRINKISSGTSTYYWLIKNNFPPGFKVLCWNCNAAKAYFGACPHTFKVNL